MKRLILITLLLIGLPALTRGKTEEAEAKRQELEQLRGKIDASRKRLEAAQGKEKSILGRIEAINRKMDDSAKRIRELEKQVPATVAAVEDKAADIRRIEKEIKAATPRIRSAARLHQRYRQAGWLKILLASSSTDEISRKVAFGRRINNYALGLIEAPVRKRAQLRQEQEALVAMQDQLERERDELQSGRAELEEERSSLQTVLGSVRRDESTAKRALKEMQQSEAELRQLIASLSQRSGLQTDFERQKGVLPWPVPGRVTQRFGQQVDPRYHTVIVNKGVTIAPSKGEATVHAVHEGRVVFADWFRGYGKMAVLDHGDGYYSVYAHLGELSIALGSDIVWNQTIGTIGQTGLSEEPQLYFEIRRDGTPLDPGDWLVGR